MKEKQKQERNIVDINEKIKSMNIDVDKSIGSNDELDKLIGEFTKTNKLLELSSSGLKKSKDTLKLSNAKRKALIAAMPDWQKKKITDNTEELSKRIQYEKTRQLDQFSKIYYNKIKINTNIDEL